MKLNKITFSAFAFLLLSPVAILTAQMNTNKNQNQTKTTDVPQESFNHSDIGNPATSGTVGEVKDGFDITAGGADIWGVKDEFNFIYVEKTGDFDIITKIESLSATHLYTKAGVMAREDLTADCRHVYFQVFPDNNSRNKNNGGYEFQYRQEKGGEMKAIYPGSYQGATEFPVAYPNVWVRLQRIKNEFTGYYSTNGTDWKDYTTYTLALPEKVYLGLAVTSHDVKNIASAKFRNIAEIIH
jgi:hypothetical protein